MNDLIMAFAIISMSPDVGNTIDPAYALLYSSYSDELEAASRISEIVDESGARWIFNDIHRIPFKRYPKECWKAIDNDDPDSYVWGANDDTFWMVRTLRQRSASLIDAPRIWEASRFPPFEAVKRAYNRNIKYRNRLEEILPYRNWDPKGQAVIRQQIKDSQELFERWSALYDATNPYRAIDDRRLGLKRLHELLGNDDWYNAKMPPYVPLWYFEEVKP